MTLIVMEV